MLTKTQEKLIDILRAELTGTDEADLAGLSEQELADIYQLAHKHNVYTLAGDYMYRHGVEWDQILWDMANAQELIKNMDKVLENVNRALTEAKIPFLILKGPEMRKLYPKPWMRLSGDIDILIHEEDKNAFTKILCNTLFYTYKQLRTEDHFTTQEGIVLDVSTSVRNPISIDKSQTLFSDIWDYSYPMSSESTLNVLSSDMFYVYSVNHTAKHLRNGGCGINHIIDLWLLNHHISQNRTNRKNRKKLLKERHLESAEEELLKLSQKWFSRNESETITYFEEFILTGSAHGTIKNRLLSKIGKKNYKQYYSTRLFVPYKYLRKLFPQITHKKWLVPFYEVYRCIYHVKGKTIAEVKHRILEINQQKQEAETIDGLFKKLGL